MGRDHQWNRRDRRLGRPGRVGGSPQASCQRERPGESLGLLASQPGELQSALLGELFDLPAGVFKGVGVGGGDGA